MFLRKSVAACFFLLISLPGLQIFTSSFKDFSHVHELAVSVQLKLNQYYDADQDVVKIKKMQLLITDDGFLRYRKYFPNGKQEYFSFSLTRFNNLRFLGSTEHGTLVLETLDDDVIVQTYDDPEGDIDSMSRTLNIPLKNLEINDLHEIESNFIQIKKELK